jgi:hypothetical protein
MAQSLASIDVAAKRLAGLRRNADLVADALAPATPDDVLAALERDVPIVLLPVRLETRVLQQPGGSVNATLRRVDEDREFSGIANAAASVRCELRVTAGRSGDVPMNTRS